SATHSIKQLEERLGVRLLQRTTRHVSTTPDGEAYYERCLRILADVEETEAGLGHGGASPRGKLRVNLQGTLARHYVIPHLPEFFARYPDLQLEIGMGERLVDLVREGIDCVLRVGEPADSSMVARRVATLQQVTCASAGYLARRGTPGTIDEVRQHSAVNFISPTSGKTYPFVFVVDGEEQLVKLHGAVSVSSAEAYADCSLQGLGLVQLPRYHVAEHLASGALVAVLEAWRPPPMPVSVMYPHQRQLSPRVRVFVDWLAEVMAPAS
ncbi:MAG: LysR substrate-binding domain-containing protein, partial [Massilia sp.]